MKFSSAIVVAGALFWGGSAFAQDASVSGTTESTGYKVGDGTVMRPSIGVETGFVSNVFYDDGNEIVSSGLLQFNGKLDFEPMADDPNASVDFKAGVSVSYLEYLSSNGAAQAQRNLGLGADLELALRPGSTFPVSIEDHFKRVNRPTNFESASSLSRDINTFEVGVGYKPAGRNLSGRLHYTNIIDIFESEQSSFANRMLNRLRLGTDWQFLPITRFYAEASYGIQSGLSDGGKASSNPIMGRVGVATAITENITLRTHIGYAYASYSAGAGYSNLIYQVEGGFRYSPLGRVRLTFDRAFNDSINSNFYGDYSAKLKLDQQLGLVLVEATAGVRFRSYLGVDMSLGGGTSRDDVILSSNVSAKYVLRDWLSLNAGYTLAVVSTDYRTVQNGEVDDPGYSRHEVLAGANATF